MDCACVWHIRAWLRQTPKNGHHTMICIEVIHGNWDTAAELRAKCAEAEEEKSLESIINLADIDFVMRYCFRE